MNLMGRQIAGFAIGILLCAHTASVLAEPLLIGPGKLGVNLESELFTRDMKTDHVKDRLRVGRQSIQLAYGVLNNLDLFIKGGLGRVIFEEADLSSKTRPLFGGGFRTTTSFWDGYFAGLSAQYQFGRVSSFEQDGATVATEDKWTESDASLFVGTKDWIPDPEPDLRFYVGARFSNRGDKLTPGVGSPGKAKQKSSVGGMIGIDYSDRKLFRFNTEVGAGDRNNIAIRFGLVF